MGLTSRKLWILIYVFYWLHLMHCLTSFSYIHHFFVFMHGFWFYLIKRRWGALNQLIRWCFCNIHHKDWLTYSSGTDRPGKVCYNFFISNELTQMVNFPTQIPDCYSHNPALLDLFLLMLVFVLQWLSLRTENLIMLSQSLCQTQ